MCKKLVPCGARHDRVMYSSQLSGGLTRTCATRASKRCEWRFGMRLGVLYHLAPECERWDSNPRPLMPPAPVALPPSCIRLPRWLTGVRPRGIADRIVLDATSAATVVTLAARRCATSAETEVPVAIAFWAWLGGLTVLFVIGLEHIITNLLCEPRVAARRRGGWI